MESMIVYRGPSSLDPSTQILGILVFNSENRKTGQMAQLFCVNANENPIESQANGNDRSICGDCVFRPSTAKPAGTPVCYVKVFQSVRSTWQANKDKTEDLRSACLLLRINEASIRLGAYGDPAALPEHIIRKLVSSSTGSTGYSHAWRESRFSWLKSYVMASCDSATDYARAKAEGWRTYRVLPKRMLPVLAAREIMCPSEIGVQCSDCLLCSGKSSDKDGRKDLAIVTH